MATGITLGDLVAIPSSQAFDLIDNYRFNSKRLHASMHARDLAYDADPLGATMNVLEAENAALRVASRLGIRDALSIATLNAIFLHCIFASMVHDQLTDQELDLLIPEIA